MTSRINYKTIDPAAYRALGGVEKYVRSSGLSESLLHLIYSRVSQINGCSFCLEMHTREARAAGETEQRLYTLSVWHDTQFFSDAECAALSLAEHVTRIGEKGVPDEVYEEVARHFDDSQIGSLLMAIGAINFWNRMSISFGLQPITPEELAAQQAVLKTA
jgi:AhpD family alkylhydroperoxidase